MSEIYSDGINSYATMEATSTGTGMPITIMIHGYNDDVSAWRYEQVWQNQPPYTIDENIAEYTYTSHMPQALRAIPQEESFFGDTYSQYERTYYTNHDVHYLHEVIDYAELGPQLVNTVLSVPCIGATIILNEIDKARLIRDNPVLANFRDQLLIQSYYYVLEFMFW